MKKKKIKRDIFTTTNSLKVLSYLIANPGKELSGSEVQKATAISRAGVYLALNELIKQGLVSKTKRGKFLFYSIIYNDSAIKQFKVLKNILILRPLIAKLKNLCKKAVLYGSISRGEDYPESDIDIFILTTNPEVVKNSLLSAKIKRKIQAVIKTPSEMPDFREKEEVFYKEIDRGIVLWEDKK